MSKPATFLQQASENFRRSLPANAVWQKPDATLSGVENHEGVLYMVLRNVKGILAVYEVHSDERLERLDHWPSAITEQI